MIKHFALIPLILCIQSVFAIDFVSNGFNSSNISLYGNATVESRILTLTNDSTFSIGRALYPLKIPTKRPNSSFVLPFSTSFIFALQPLKNMHPGHGLVFLFVPHTGVDGATAAQYLGVFNLTNNRDPNNHILGVEFDLVQNLDFRDINKNHVGIDVNSLESVAAHDAGYWPDDKPFQSVQLGDGKNYQVWVDYADSQINVTMVEAGMKRPKRPLISTPIDLSPVFEDEMYVGFTASTGAVYESVKILAWSYSNENFSLSDALITENLPSFELRKDSGQISKGFIAGMTVGLVLLLVTGSFLATVLLMKRRRRKREEKIEDWESEYWPHKISYREIAAATKGFSEKNVIGVGGNGKVFKGVLPGGAEVAVKRISTTSHGDSDGMKEFVSEISSLGRLKHRNLVGLKGWCKEKKNSLILVYDYMENGSLDKKLFECDDENMVLNCSDRMRILKDVASALWYLHEGWESKVLHRDIKAGNVLLDRDMNARLGDFGLARVQDHDREADPTLVVGTAGYMAPELVKNGRASAQTDVYSFGILILEVMCGRRPIEQGKPALVDWLLELKRKGELLNAVDERLRDAEGLNQEETEKVLHLALLCTHPDPNHRPTTRQIVKLLVGETEISEPEVVDMNEWLRMRIQSEGLWSSTSRSTTRESHVTFDEIKEGLSSSMSLSWSDSLAEGR